MKMKIKVLQEVDLAIAECWIHARYWEDSLINGVEDDASNPKMPCIEEHLGEQAWHIIINLDNGQIVNWPAGSTAHIHYKSCDENYIDIIDRETCIVKEYEGYVPNFLCPNGAGYSDYVKMDIDEKGFIKNFNNNVDDVFEVD